MKEQYCVLGDHTWTPDPGRGLAAKACPVHYDRNALRRWRRAQDPEGHRDNRTYQDRLKRDPEGVRASHRRHALNRRAWKLGQFVEDVDPQIVYVMHGGMCGICEQFIEGDFHVDHATSLSRGGIHGYINVQPAHPLCNLRKNASN